MRIWTRKSASIQPRTSLRKSDCVVAGEPSIRRLASPSGLPRAAGAGGQAAAENSGRGPPDPAELPAGPPELDQDRLLAELY